MKTATGVQFIMRSGNSYDIVSSGAVETGTNRPLDTLTIGAVYRDNDGIFYFKALPMNYGIVILCQIAAFIADKNWGFQNELR
jgi:hypothetical protein